VSDLIKNQEIKPYSASIAADLIYSVLVEASMAIFQGQGEGKSSRGNPEYHYGYDEGIKMDTRNLILKRCRLRRGNSFLV